MRFVNPFIRIFSSRVVFGALLLGIPAGVSLLASDWEKYLAAVGPTPIRLLSEAPRLNPMKALPRLRMSDAVEVVTAAEPQPVTKEAIVRSSGASNEEPGTSPEITLMEPLPSVTNNEPAMRQEPAAQVSPQMLLRYFTGNGTNEVLVPYSVDFTPPVPRRSGDSKAVYIVQ